MIVASCLLAAWLEKASGADVLVTTLAGKASSSGNLNGYGTNAKFNTPEGIDISSDGTFALVAEYYNNWIRKINVTTGEVTILAGGYGSQNGQGTNAKFYYPEDICISSDDSFALVADMNNHMIRKVNISTAEVTTLAGRTYYGYTNGVGTNAQFDYPKGVALSPDDSFALVTDSWNNMIRKIIISTAEVSSFVGMKSPSGSANGFGSNAQFNKPEDVEISPDGRYALVSDGNHLIRNITISTGEVGSLAGQPTYGHIDGYGTNAMFSSPRGISISHDGDELEGEYALIADTSSFQFRKIIISTAQVTTIAGGSYGSDDGVGTNAEFYSPQGVVVSFDGVFALVSDSSNHLIRHMLLVDPPSSSPTSSPTEFPSVTPTISPSISQDPTFAPTQSPTSVIATQSSSDPSFFRTTTFFAGLGGCVLGFVIALFFMYRFFCHVQSTSADLLKEEDVELFVSKHD